MLTFRIDDVSANTDLTTLKQMISFLKETFVCEVWACLSLFSQRSFEGSVYPSPPFKHQDRKFFYDVNQFLDAARVNLKGAKFVSHGLFHVDHNALQYDAQEMSIVSSCNLVGTDIFVPPFNRFNTSTESVCRHHLLTLVKSDEGKWKSLEHNEFNLSSHLWYFHPWRYTLESFKLALSPSRSNVPA